MSLIESEAIPWPNKPEPQGFYGAVYFDFTQNGWRVSETYHFLYSGNPKPEIGTYITEVSDIRLRVQVLFKTQPRAGQFSKRPHKLLEFEHGH
jgi:hypothetical protein